MARIKVSYLGGGSTRAAGTVASFLHHGEEFNGSEIMLIDLIPERLELVAELGRKMAKHLGLNITFLTSTERKHALADSNAVLSSFRPGDFAARVHDERIPLKHGIIGQETQGPGGFFMALRSIAVLRKVVEDMVQVAPGAVLFNYTNPVNIVSQALTEHCDVPVYSFCEGPIVFPQTTLRAAELDPNRAQITMAGINHNCWSTTHTYDGRDLMPLLDAAWERRKNDPTMPVLERQMLELAVTMRSVPADYFQYYFYRDETFRRLRSDKLTRAEHILAEVSGYWEHYREQANSVTPELDPQRSRGGIHELELAIDAMNAYFNNDRKRLPVNLPNAGGALPGFDERTVVEVWCHVDRTGVTIEPQHPLPAPALPITQQLANFQTLTARAAWSGSRREAIQALLSHPLLGDLHQTTALYDELAEAHQAFLPERLRA